MAAVEPSGSAEIVNGRLEVVFQVDRDQSLGTYQLREILEKAGFKEEGGFVRTKEALAPLEIYNYLYTTGPNAGRYDFTIILPLDQHSYATFGKRGAVSFQGTAAQKLFEVVKLYATKNELPLVEQYTWSDSFCDRTKSGEVFYRCYIGR